MILTRNLISHLGVILILTQIILFTWFVSGYFHFQGFNIISGQVAYYTLKM